MLKLLKMNQMGGHITVILTPIHTCPEKFENGGFTLKTHQMFFMIHTMRKEFYKIQQSPVIMSRVIKNNVNFILYKKETATYFSYSTDT